MATISLLGTVAAPALGQDHASARSGVAAADSTGAEGGPYYYRGLSYGSEAYMGPLDVLVNQGFALAQNENVNRRVFDFPYGFNSVHDALAHPAAAIRRGGGLWRFIRTEILPLSVGQQAKWYPNYTGHFMEGGIHFRRLYEWLDARDVPLPMLWSAIWNLAGSYLNELYETGIGGQRVGTVATVADLMFWDVAAVAAFSQESVARFFARTLHANVWTDQAALTLPAAELQNMGSHLIFKLPISPIPNTSAFISTGISFQAGITLHRHDDLDISVGVGAVGSTLKSDPVTGEETTELELSAGTFVDRNGSLLFHFDVSRLEDRMVTVNVYPGVLGPRDSFIRSLGAWLILTRRFGLRLGLSSRFTLGLGAGIQSR